MLAGLAVVAAGLLALAGAAPDRPLVRTALGDLRGAWLTSNKGSRYAAFTGVPFAKPPVGPLRFEPPQPLGEWLGEWDAGLEAPSCMAFSHLLGAADTVRIKGQEDCLYLNVYTPKVPELGRDSEDPLDVLVYIHGGAFMFGGSSAYGAKLLMDRQVVLVTINYRLGPLGFLSLGDSWQPGNHGLRDQVAALRWVHDHIARFGGDPASVTLAGGSAGGASVHYHFLSPLSRGLFSGGISFSGTSLCRWALTEQARSKALQLAAGVGCGAGGGSRGLLECLRQRPAQQIVEQVAQFQVWQYSPFTPFGPVVEPPGAAPFLPDWPVRLLRRGEAARVPWATGVTSGEGLYPAAAFVAQADQLAELERHFASLAPHLLDFNLTVEDASRGHVVDAVRREYFGDKPVAEDTVHELIKMIGDRLFVVDAQRAAELQAEFSPVFFYQFDFRGKHSLSELMSDSDRDFGVSHSDDVTYFMNVSFVKDAPRHGDEARVESLVLDLWTSFAKDRVPRSAGVTWTPVTPGGDLEMLHIDGPSPSMTKVTDLGNAAFWESLPLLEAPQSLVHRETTKDEL